MRDDSWTTAASPTRTPTAMTTKVPFPVILVMLCISMISLTLIDCSATAQVDASIAALTPDVALGRTLAREAGLRAYQRDDGPAIHAVISFRAEHIYRTSYLTAVMRATHSAPIRLDAPRPWITQLVPSMRRPTLYPGHLRWEGRGDHHWRLTLGHARQIRRGEIEHQCRRPGAEEGPDEFLTPHDWGSEHDAMRLRRDHPEAIELDCGQTCSLDPSGVPRFTTDGLPKCNHWFHFPRYEERFGEG